jgi:hypothetical protein
MTMMTVAAILMTTITTTITTTMGMQNIKSMQGERRL